MQEIGQQPRRLPAVTGALNAIPFLTGGKPVVSNITGRIVNKFGDMFKEGTTEGLQAFVQQFGATAATEKGYRGY